MSPTETSDTVVTTATLLGLDEHGVLANPCLPDEPLAGGEDCTRIVYADVVGPIQSQRHLTGTVTASADVLTATTPFDIAPSTP